LLCPPGLPFSPDPAVIAVRADVDLEHGRIRITATMYQDGRTRAEVGAQPKDRRHADLRR
jgi:hypothetical protein